VTAGSRASELAVARCDGWGVVRDGVRVAAVVPGQLAAAAELHEQLAAIQFVARAGRRFLRRYYLAWSRTAAGMALAATDEAGELRGVLLGAIDPAAHYQEMLRRDGVALAARLIARGATSPRFGRELIATRLRRYARGIARTVIARRRRAVAAAPATGRAGAIGEIAVLLVDAHARGSGVGRALLGAATERARRAGLSALTLVTPPDLAAGGFYEHLGWRAGEAISSRSGERFIVYRLWLADATAQQPDR